jgi:hypothetical protein
MLTVLSGAAEAVEMIRYALAKGAIIRTICKNCYKRFRGRNFDLEDRDQFKNLAVQLEIICCQK